MMSLNVTSNIMHTPHVILDKRQNGKDNNLSTKWHNLRYPCLVFKSFHMLELTVNAGDKVNIIVIKWCVWSTGSNSGHDVKEYS